MMGTEGWEWSFLREVLSLDWLYLPAPLPQQILQNSRHVNRQLTHIYL